MWALRIGLCALFAHLEVLLSEGRQSPPDADCGSDGSLCDKTSGYLVLLDAGSTGTRAHAFHYDRRTLGQKKFPYVVSSPLTLPHRLASFKAKPGISAFYNDTSGIPRSLMPILKAVADALLLHDPSIDFTHVPVYLGATAGMRTLKVQERDRVMAAVRQFLRSKANPFSFPLDEQARVLAGEEEGAFGWLALNQMQATISSSPNETFGSLDFGGGSMQIAFIPTETSILANFFPMHFGGAVRGPIHLYSHSFLRFGMTDAFQRATGKLQRKNRSEVLHPCMPKGVTWEVEPGEFGVTTKSGKPVRSGGPLTLRGTGDFAACQEIAKQLIIEAPCFQPPCSMLGVYQPRLNGTRFVLFSEHEEFKNWEVTPLLERGLPLLRALRLQLPRVCALPFETQLELFGPTGLLDTGAPPCWRGTWMLVMLHDGLKFPDEGRDIVTVPNCCDYSLGQATYEVNFFPFRIAKYSYDSVFLSDPDAAQGSAPALGAWDLRTSLVAVVAGAVGAAAILGAQAVARVVGRRRRFEEETSDARTPLLVA